MAPQGSIFGIVGALSAFPRQLAAREVEGRGAQLRRGSTRGTSHVVFGRGLLASATAGALETRVEAERRAGRQLLSENGFLRLLGLKRGPAAGELDEAAICQQAKLSAQDLAMLGLFDCFECAPPLYGFRDLILAKKYAGLIASGAGWFTVARAIHRSGPVASLTALSLLAVDTDEIYVRSRDGLSDLGGQLLLPIARGGEPDAEELFAEAEAAEADGRFAEAAELYRRCLAADPAEFGGRLQPRQLPQSRGPERGSGARLYPRPQTRPEICRGLVQLRRPGCGARPSRSGSAAPDQGARGRPRLRRRDLQPRPARL